MRTSLDRLLKFGVDFIRRIARIDVLIVLVLLSLLFPLWFFPAHGIGDLLPLDLNLYQTPSNVYEHLFVLKADERNAYLEMALTSDLLFPVVYAIALSVLLMMVMRKLVPPKSRLLYLCLFPFMIVIFDWSENLTLATITAIFPERIESIVYLASFFTSMKWMLVALSIIMLLTALGIRAVTIWKKRGSH